jgi:hypothetical protein
MFGDGGIQNMKNKIQGGISIALIAIACLYLLYNWSHLTYIQTSRVERIDICRTKEETDTFIKLFNEAEYVGLSNGEGGTPRYEIKVYYRDGSVLRISEFGSVKAKFEVSLGIGDGYFGIAHYFKSDELEAFIEEVFVNHGEH